jgi:RNA polymerase sigma factor (sigma-70 family)
VDVTDFFRADWPAMSGRLRGAFARRGVQSSDLDDIVQETAIRLFRSWEHLDPDRSVEPYARAIAMNVWRDGLRRGPREEPVELVPEQASAGDEVEQVCVWRDELSRVVRAVDRLRPEQRRVLHALAAEEIGTSPVTQAAPDALRMARMRARRDLRVALQTASALATVMWAGLRRHGQLAPAAMLPVAMVMLAVLDLAHGPAPSAVPLTVSPQQAQRVVGVPPVRAAVVPLVAPVRVVATSQEPGVPRRVTEAASPQPSFYWVGAGEAQVGASVDVQVDGYGVRIGENGNGLPICVVGVETGDPPVGAQASCRP